MILMDKYLLLSFPDAKLQIRFTQVVVGTIVLNHVVCCFWYAVGLSAHSDTGERWIAVWLDTREELTTSRVFKYLTSFHWTIAQITLGAIDITPTNSIERVFCILLLILGMLFNATIVSLISSQTMEWVSRRAEKDEIMTTVVRFLEQHHLDKGLQQQVRRQLLDRLARRSTVLSEREVPGLNVLAIGLRSEVLHMIRRPHLLKHTLFKVWSDSNAVSIRRLTDNATKIVSAKPQDIIFVPGAHCGDTYLVMYGNLRYCQDSETSLVNQDVAKTVTQDQWISEAALWVHWQHVGKLEAEGSCHLMLLNATEMLQALTKFPDIAAVTRAYGREYHLRIIAAKPPHSNWPSDLHVPFTSPSDLMSDKFSLELLRREAEKGAVIFNEQDIEALTKEISEDKCSLQTNELGELERVVFVLAVRLKREVDDYLWSQIGSVSKGKLKPDCTMPGRKRKRGEMVDEAYEELLKEWLSPFGKHVEAMEVEQTEEVKDSGTYKIQTRYMRVVQHAMWPADAEDPEMVVATYRGESKQDLENNYGGGRAMRELFSSPVFVLSMNGQSRLFAWIEPDMCTWLSSPGGAPLLEAWLNSLQVDDSSDVKGYVAPVRGTTGASLKGLVAEAPAPIVSLPTKHSTSNSPGKESQIQEEGTSKQKRRKSVGLADSILDWQKQTRNGAWKGAKKRLRRLASRMSQQEVADENGRSLRFHPDSIGRKTSSESMGSSQSCSSQSGSCFETEEVAEDLPPSQIEDDSQRTSALDAAPAPAAEDLQPTSSSAPMSKAASHPTVITNFDVGSSAMQSPVAPQLLVDEAAGETALTPSRSLDTQERQQSNMRKVQSLTTTPPLPPLRQPSGRVRRMWLTEV
mmetsp:Transcript_43119/g.101275  ORF Transcript_43119/g.101275 Transcript_43119/m.101275 type:complete len:858 (+) Transcript_43119:1-2574(+)